MFLINEVNMMDAISSFEQAVEEKYGIPIVNVSHWDSSLAFQKSMKQVLSLPRPALPWNYCYSYSLSDQMRQQVLINLGVPSKRLPETMALLLQSSTIAIINIVSFFPGTLNGFSLAQGLNFRLNLTGDPQELPNTLDQILTYLNQYYCM